MVKYKVVYFTFIWISFLLIAGLSVDAQEIIWEQTNGPYGGFIDTLLTTPDNILYAAMRNGIFRSQNRGDSWTKTGLAAGWYTRVLAFLDGMLYASTELGLYRSVDGGDSWQFVGLERQGVRTLVNHGGVLYAGASKGVFRSDDNGESWNAFNAGLPVDYPSVESLVFLKDTLYALAESNRGIFRWDAQNNRWVRTGLREHPVKFFTAVGTTLYASVIADGLYCSADGGNSWQPVDIGLPTPSVTTMAAVGKSLYMGIRAAGGWKKDNSGRVWMPVYRGRVLRSDDGGYSWTTPSPGLKDHHITSLTAIGNTLFAGTLVGLFRSTDGGDSWTSVNKGLVDVIVDDILNFGTSLYVATSIGVYRSGNGGDSWTPINDGMPYHADVSALATIGNTVYAGTLNQGVFRLVASEDRWIPVGLTDLYIYTLFAWESTLYAGTMYGIFRSADGGESWQASSTGLKEDIWIPHQKRRTQIVVSFVVWGTTLYAGTHTGIYRSENRGDTWIQLTEEGGSLEVIGTTLYATASRGVLRSEDGGETWKNVSDGLPDSVHSFSCLTSANGVLYAGLDGSGYDFGGVFQLEAGSDMWTPINNGLTNDEVISLETSGTTLYAGTRGSGLFRASLSR